MNVAIIDDEVHCIESLVIHLTELFPNITVVYKSNKVQEAAKRLPELSVDLVFLDIEMPGMNGFELLEQIPERHFDVIFTTAYSQYAIQAFKTRAINYLLKPIDEDELKEAVVSWQENQKNNADNDPHKLEQLLEHLKKEGFMKSKISVPVSDGYEFIEVNRIIYCNSQSNYTKIYLTDGEKVLVSKTMKEVEKTLSPFYFIRVHQSYMVNPNYMKKFYRTGGGYIEMTNKTTIPVSQSKRKFLLTLFKVIKKDEH